MAVEPEDEELLLDTPAEDEGAKPDDEQEEQGPGSEKPEEEGDEELEIAFGDEAAPASGERDTGLVKHLREEVRKRDQRIAELAKAQPHQQTEVGPEPTLESCEWDEDRFKTETRAWLKRQEEAEAAKTTVQQQNRVAEEAWQADVQRFESRKAELKVPGAEEAIETALATLPQVAAAVIVKAADNPALVLAALGQHPGKLAEIASIQDPLKQAVAVAKLEGTLKVAPRRKAPEPEKIAGGNARVTQGTDQTLAALEKKADKTGDRTELIRYRKQQSERAKK